MTLRIHRDYLKQIRLVVRAGRELGISNLIVLPGAVLAPLASARLSEQEVSGWIFRDLTSVSTFL